MRRTLKTEYAAGLKNGSLRCIDVVKAFRFAHDTSIAPLVRAYWQGALDGLFADCPDGVASAKGLDL